jgi:hypothetical protein
MNEQPAATNRAANDCQKRSQFDDPISPREPPFRKQFRQQTIFGRTKESALRSHQENSCEQKKWFTPDQRRGRQPHDDNLSHLGPNRHCPLAVSIRQITASHRKNDERKRKQRSDRSHPQLSRIARKMR